MRDISKTILQDKGNLEIVCAQTILPVQGTERNEFSPGCGLSQSEAARIHKRYDIPLDYKILGRDGENGKIYVRGPASEMSTIHF